MSQLPESDESDEMLSDSEEPPYVHVAEDGTQRSSIPPNSSCTHARDIIHRPINKIVNANYHSSSQIPSQIKMLSMSHSMGLAATGYVEHGVSMHLCTVGQCQLQTFRPCFPKPSLLFSGGKWKFCDRFDTGLSRRKRRTDVISSVPSFCSCEPEGISFLSLTPQIQRIMAQSLRRCRCSS